MGVIYKLKPKIKHFILKAKTNKPSLSCRKLAVLTNEKFQIKLSKSHINSVIKAAGLSNKVGRRRKRHKGVIEADGLGVIMLKAVDALVGGSWRITDAIKKRLNETRPDLAGLLDCLLYFPLFEPNLGPDSGLWKLAGKYYSPEELLSYLNKLKGVATLNTEISGIINTLFEEVLFIKLIFSEGGAFFFDSRFHSLWSSPRIPYDFSLPYHQVKNNIENAFSQNQPIILLCGPGYEVLPKEWLNFLISANSPTSRVGNIGLFGTKSQKLETITLNHPQNCSIIFGLWPWQYTKSRKVEFLNEFKPAALGAQRQRLYLAETMIKLFNSTTKKELTLRGVTLKKNPQTQQEVTILSNIPKEKLSAESLANLYLSRWPGMQNAFKNFSRKIELFTYSAASHQIFSIESLFETKAASPGAKDILAVYLKALDGYLRWYFLPKEYKGRDLATTKKRFYSLRARIKKRKDSYIVRFILPGDYPFTKELNLCVSELNRQGIHLAEGKRLIFEEIA